MQGFGEGLTGVVFGNRNAIHQYLQSDFTPDNIVYLALMYNKPEIAENTIENYNIYYPYPLEVLALEKGYYKIADMLAQKADTERHHLVQENDMYE
jgi:hypothetical protein